MTRLSKQIFENYQIRKTKKQKTEFIEFMQNNYPDMQIEEGGFGGNRNLIIGDVDKAKIVVSAHYDTCAKLPIPNFIAPRNHFANIVYQVGIAFVFLFLANLVAMIFQRPELFLIMYIPLIFVVFMGKPNPNTANDNTSGVITLVETISKLNQEKQENKDDMAFVFFDNEENGLLGSRFFKKKHKQAMKNKLLINIDCVSDGDNIMLVANKKAKGYIGDNLYTNFALNDEKKVIISNSVTTFYPSDQAGYKCTIAICSLKYKKFLGYYMDKIHTKADVNFDEKNIEIISDGILNCID